MILLGGEENLILGLENKQILQVPFTSERVVSEENLKFEHVGLPYHSEKITGLDICIRKTLIGTCSTDRTVRIWNYMERTLENFKEFDEEAFALAFHPSGYSIK
jgi:WD40 repeat protein